MIEFTITCNECESTSISIVTRHSGNFDPEYDEVRTVLKCRECGNEKAIA